MRGNFNLPYDSFADVGGKEPEQQAQDDSQKNDFKRIHADRIIFILIILGIISLFGSIILGIVLVQGLGWLVDLILEKINADTPDTLGMDNYVTDFLGGAVGLTVGFILDKICIEKINNIFHYKALMRVLLNELEHINIVAAMNIIVLLGYVEIVLKNETSTSDKFKQAINKLQEYLVSQQEVEILQKNTKLKQEHTEIKEYIIDDVAMTAETVSVIANIPFAKQRTLSLINNISIIHKEIESHNDLSRECKQKEEQTSLLLEHLKKIKESISNIKKLISRDSQNAKKQ